MSSVGERIKQLRKKNKLTQHELASLVGVTTGAVSQWESDQIQPNGARTTALAQQLGTTAEWIQTGVEPTNGRRDIAEGHGLYLAGGMDLWGSDTPLTDDEVALPLFREVELSAGSGRFEVIENNGAKLRFARSTLKRAGVDPACAACAFVAGDSMLPVLPDGSCIGIDTGATGKRIIDGKMYAIDHGGLLKVKALFRQPGGGLRIHSYNREYPDEVISSEEMASEVRVIGKVFWYSVML